MTSNVCNICHKWARDYVESSSSEGMFTIQIHCCGGTGKSQVEKTISAVNLCGTTYPSGLGIKPDAQLFILNDKMESNLRNKLPDIKRIIIYEISMVSRGLLLYSC